MKVIKVLCIAIISLVSLGCYAQTDEGIKMSKGSWKEIVDLAKAANKPIFVDVYTKWCGPCLNMATTVFKDAAVGNFYNENFICVQIDAEEGEGIDFAKKYGVRLYPTYLFIDPSSQEILHRSTSVQSAPNFITTGKGALDPKLSCFYLDNQFESGNEDPEFLKNYIEYNAISYKREAILAAFEKLVKQGDGLKDPQTWAIFDQRITGYSPYIRTISDNYDEYVAALGKKAVDDKLATATAYISTEELASLCDFDGKELNMRLSIVEKLARDERYDEAVKLIDEDIFGGKYTTDEKYLNRLIYLVRQIKYYPDKFPDFYIEKCIEYARHIAYNWPERTNAEIHQLYASMLELAIGRNTQPTELEKKLLQEPSFGKKVYDMRNPKLTEKPKRK